MPATLTSPTLLPTPITPEARMGYVLRQFWQVYGPEREVSVGRPGSQAQVEIADGAGDFFAGSDPMPPPPVWRIWRGQRLPFFFSDNSQDDLLTRQPGQAFIGADIISAAFFLLSGWQEYVSEARDQHGRFPYAASVQFRYGFVGLPVVNYYFDLLKTAIEHVTQTPLKPRTWPGGAPMAAFISHDIDLLRGSWKVRLKQALRQRSWATALRALWHRCRHADAWDNLEDVAAQTSQYGGKSTFFILPCPRPAPDGTPNADYYVGRRLRARLQRLAGQGHEVGLHGSIGSSLNATQLRRERAQLNGTHPSGHRFHYLKWDPRRTPSLLDEVGFAYDSTLGFAEHFGFRHSYCHPFQPFNFGTLQEHSFLEIPLLLMDATLHHPNYLQLSSHEILPALRPVLAEVEKFGGIAGILWHNNHFDPENQVNGPAQFHELMQDLQQRGAAFLTGTATVAHVRNGSRGAVDSAP